MSTRERWIVYPLLFLALGAALRDKVLHPGRLVGTVVQADAIGSSRIYCDELQVGRVTCNGPSACGELAVQGRAECRALLVIGPNGRPVVGVGADAKSHNGELTTLAANGAPLVQLGSTPAGGVVATIGRSGRIVAIGETGQPNPDRADKPPAPPATRQDPAKDGKSAPEEPKK
jgi:hypothetical protein